MTITIDQSTSATKAFLFDDQCKLIKKAAMPHKQYYPQPGWVEHDAMEIYRNAVSVIHQLMADTNVDAGNLSIAITNQRETVVVWDRTTGEPVYNAVVWQCMRGAQICEQLRADGYTDLVKERSGLLIDPFFAGSGAKWILDNVENARAKAEAGELCFGTIDSWLIYKLTEGREHLTDYTNASRTMLFNIHTLDWDDDLLKMLTIPRSMMPRPLPCDATYGTTTVEGLFPDGIQIAGVLGDSHGALAGQMCYREGLGKATYGTGSSVMVNIGETYKAAPDGLVTSVGFAAAGKVHFAFEGNIHCTGATLQWLRDQLKLINDASETEALATSLPDNGGVYFVPAFSGLGAPWWNDKAKGTITGLTLASTRAHVCRAALESIAYQVTDLINAMTLKAGVKLEEVRVDGGPTKNRFLMQMQADLLRAKVVRSEVEDASAFGALIMNGFALSKWSSWEEAQQHWTPEPAVTPQDNELAIGRAYHGWQKAIGMII